VEEQREQEEVQVQPMVTEVPVAAAIEPVVSAPVIEEVAETAEVVVAEPEVVTQPAAPVVAEVAAEVETVA
ncbi:hypothetical protein UZ967_25160, partial [Escherichia coli]|nr:hypothetical protein [Escherichia coli]